LDIRSIGNTSNSGGLAVNAALRHWHSQWHATALVNLLFCFALPRAAAVGLSEEARIPTTSTEHTAPHASESDAAVVIETLFTQPVTPAEFVDERIIGEVHPAGERFLVRMANMGTEADVAKLSWDVGRYTGLRLGTGDSASVYQRGPGQVGEGTAVQLRGNEIGIWIDSDHPRPQQGELLPVCPAYWWWNVATAPRPFSSEDRELSFSFDLKVPTALRQGKAEVYICAHFLLRDKRSGKQFWLGASLFDLRAAENFPDTVHMDNWAGGTGLPILFAALNDRSKWFHPGPGSACFSDKPFDDYRRFDYRVRSSELHVALTAIRDRLPHHADMSSDPGDYQLTHFNLNPEVYSPNDSRGQLGLSIRDIRVRVLGRR
jgi:hypothetical protein